MFRRWFINDAGPALSALSAKSLDSTRISEIYVSVCAPDNVILICVHSVTHVLLLR